MASITATIVSGLGSTRTSTAVRFRRALRRFRPLGGGPGIGVDLLQLHGPPDAGVGHLPVPTRRRHRQRLALVPK